MPTVCLVASALYYPEGAGHLWVFLNWALGLRSNGCKVIWLEEVDISVPEEVTMNNVILLKEKLAYYEPDIQLALWQSGDINEACAAFFSCLSLDQAGSQTDLLLNQRYGLAASILQHFKKTALLDIDPGLLQTWISMGAIQPAKHDYYFTTGETVGSKHTMFPDCGIKWIYVPPCVSTAVWLPTAREKNAPFTTITQWDTHEWLEQDGEPYRNDKRQGYLPYLDLPKNVPVTLELATPAFEPES